MVTSREPTGVYALGCPNCGGPITDARLFDRLPCPKCLPEPPAEGVETLVDVAELLRKQGRLNENSPLAFYARVEAEAREVEVLFEKATGSRLWSAQRTWVRRVLKGKSFAIIAPTGVGKTTFGILMSIYFASKGLKSYIVVPTTPLVQMVEEKARKMAEAAGLDITILAIHSRLPVRERNARLRRMLEGDFDILITTARMLQTRIDELLAVSKKIGGFKFVFVDDVDAVLKSSKSVRNVLRLLGFPDDLLDPEKPESAWELVTLRRRLLRLLDEYARASRQGSGVDKVRERIEEIAERIRRIEERIEEYRRKAPVLVVSSATGRPRGRMVRLFTVLLGFQAGSRSETLRSITDTYVVPRDGLEETVISIVSKLVRISARCGGLVYVPVDRGAAYAEYLAEKLREKGIRAEPFTSKNVEALERFRRGETDVLVGVAVYYGVAVRGLDIPERICWAVFAGVPRLKLSARLEDPHPTSILRALALLADHAPSDIAEEAEKLLARLRRIYQRLSQAAVQAIAEELRKGSPESQYAREFASALDFLRKALARADVWKALEKAPDIAIVKEDGRSYILIPDAATYIQASGRTSRLYAGGITRGLSIVVADDERLLNGLIRRTRWWVEAEWKSLDEIDLEALLAQLEEDRRELIEILEGKRKPETLGKELVTSALLIVESPNKARTIASFFGRPSVREVGPVRVYEVSTGDYLLLVAASGGHVYDLVKPAKRMDKPSPTWLVDKLAPSLSDVHVGRIVNTHGVLVTDKGVYPVYAPLARCMMCGSQWTLDPEEVYTGRREIRCPVCGSSLVRTSWDTVEALRDLATEVDVVFIGTDPDTEGEKIGWDLAALIAPYAKSIARVEFHEITRKAILNAIRNAKPYGVHKMTVFSRRIGGEATVDAVNLVKAQIVRRVEDRWIGFTLSPILWNRFWPEFCKRRALEYVTRLSKAIADRKAAAEWLRQAERDPLTTLANLLDAITKKKLKLVKYSRSVINNAQALLERCCETVNGVCRTRINYNLSAGRVQTPVLGWIVEHSIVRRVGKKLVISISIPELELVLRIDPARIPGLAEEYQKLVTLEEKIRECLRSCVERGCGVECSDLGVGPTKSGAGGVVVRLLAKLKNLGGQVRAFGAKLSKLAGEGVKATVEVVGEDVVEVKPLPPYTTDALLADAAAKLGLSPPQAMRIAQDLFELGFITYHRTDSTRVSDAGIAIAREYLRERFGDEEAEKLFTPRTWGVGGAHEAIRPTRPIDADRLRRLVEEGVIQPVRPLTRNHYRLYDLIFRRFIASQMRPAKLRRQKVRVKLSIAGGEVVEELELYTGVEEEGFLKMYPTVMVREPVKPGVYDAEVNVRLVPLGELLTESDVVRLMRERGIGRPSTYAKIVETLFRRAYVTRVGRAGRVAATKRGLLVYDFLVDAFPELVSEEVTRKLEDVMDSIELETDPHAYIRVLHSILNELCRALEEAGMNEYMPPGCRGSPSGG